MMVRFEEFLSPKERAALEGIPDGANAGDEDALEKQDLSADDKHRYDRFKDTRTVSEEEIHGMVVKRLIDPAGLDDVDNVIYEDNTEEVDARIDDIENISSVQREEAPKSPEEVDRVARLYRTLTRGQSIDELPEDVRKFFYDNPVLVIERVRELEKEDMESQVHEEKPSREEVENVARLYNALPLDKNIDELSEEAREFFLKNEDLVMLRAKILRDVSSRHYADAGDRERYNNLMGFDESEKEEKIKELTLKLLKQVGSYLSISGDGAYQDIINAFQQLNLDRMLNQTM